MNNDNTRWSEVGPKPRTAGRRFIDTEFRLDHARANGASIKRLIVLETGYRMLDAEFTAEVKRELSDGLFTHLGKIFEPTAKHA